MLAGGGEAIADIDVLRHQEQVLGPVASAPMVWRALDELTPARLDKIDKARARVRLLSSKTSSKNQQRRLHNDGKRL